MISIASIVDRVFWFYSILLFAYVVLSWFPAGGVMSDLRHALRALCEPYLSIFRRVIPPVGMVDISPIVAFLALSMIRSVVVRLLQSIGM